MNAVAPIDPNIAGATLQLHLDKFLRQHGRSRDFQLIELDGVTAVVAIKAVRGDGKVDWFTTLHNGSWYDALPTQVSFVEREAESWEPAALGSPGYPLIAGSPTPAGTVSGTAPLFQFALHPDYQYPDGSQRQLVCFSHSYDYYISNHTPTERQRWTQGIHTISATLTRLHEVLQAPHYQGPSDAHHP